MQVPGGNQSKSANGPHCPMPRVLIVDQERADLDYYSSVLLKRGFQVQTCESYEEGMWRLDAGSFDFIILDQGSPHFEGRCVLERSIAKNRRLPVLVVARCHNMHCYLDAMQLGAVDYLAEPVAASDFQWVVDTHLPSSVPRT